MVSNHDSSGSSCIGLRYTIQGSNTRTPSNALTIAWFTMRLVKALGAKRCSRRMLTEIPSPTAPGSAAIAAPSRKEKAESFALSLREWLSFRRSISPQRSAAWRAVKLSSAQSQILVCYG